VANPKSLSSRALTGLSRIILKFICFLKALA
jgi:hypothetical protein